MKEIYIKILLLLPLFFLGFNYTDSSVYAQSESHNSFHEMPDADQCSIITLHIRQLASDLKATSKEISLLEAPVHSDSTENDHYGQQQEEYDQQLELLQKKVSSLRKQIDIQEQQLGNCLQSIITPAGKNDTHAAQKKSGFE